MIDIMPRKVSESSGSSWNTVKKYLYNPDVSLTGPVFPG